MLAGGIVGLEGDQNTLILVTTPVEHLRTAGGEGGEDLRESMRSLRVDAVPSKQFKDSMRRIRDEISTRVHA